MGYLGRLWRSKKLILVLKKVDSLEQTHILKISNKYEKNQILINKKYCRTRECKF